ncbi:MAG: 1,4-dihydroxy-2-naphthoate octaprenyltransferase [Crocinitomicaceae bacterium]
MLKHWISAFRLRTLPLALSTIFMGNCLAIMNNCFNTTIFFLSILVTILLQILSNLANDYGDGVKGTDNEHRLGPIRAIQSGAISKRAMLNAVIIFSILSLGLGLLLVFISLSNPIIVTVFVVLGLSAILAAIKYTIGKKAYGYHGLGDLFVFIFFGLVGVLGTYYLQTQTLELLILLPAIGIGCFSTAVLNLNNMRDIDNDRASNKNTLVVKMGLARAKKYHFTLFIVAYISLFTFAFLQNKTSIIYSFASALVFFVILHVRHLLTIKKAENYKSFDPQLKIVALTSFGLSIVWFIIINMIKS